MSGAAKNSSSTSDSEPVGLSASILAESRPSTNFSFAAKARARGRAALGPYPLIVDRLGQCLVSDGFETRIGRADKAKPIQTKKFAIHTLGHVPTFAVTRNQVCSAAMNRHSALTFACCSTGARCLMLSRLAARIWPLLRHTAPQIRASAFQVGCAPVRRGRCTGRFWCSRRLTRPAIPQGRPLDSE